MMHVFIPHGHYFWRVRRAVISVNHTLTSRSIQYLLLRGKHRHLLDALALCLYLSADDSLTNVHISTDCQAAFTVTGFIKAWMNYSGRASEWLRKMSMESCLFNNLFFFPSSSSGLSIIQTPSWSCFTTSLFVSLSLEPTIQRAERCRGSGIISASPAPRRSKEQQKGV